jgi:glutathione S-transferase
MPQPEITLYFLQASRAIRIAWLLHELQLPYNLQFFEREKDKAPPNFRIASGNILGKSPTLHLDGVVIQESGAIAEILCSQLDKEGRLTGGRDLAKRAKILEWVHAAEGTFMVHALAILYARWSVPGTDSLAATEEALSYNVQRDLDWLEDALGKRSDGWIMGETFSLADIMVQFSVEFIFARQLGIRDVAEEMRGRRWENVKAWLRMCGERSSYRSAVERTGYTLFPETGVSWREHV